MDISIKRSYFFALCTSAFYHANNSGMAIERLINKEQRSPSHDTLIWLNQVVPLNQSITSRKPNPIFKKNNHNRFKCFKCPKSYTGLGTAVEHFKKKHAESVKEYFRYVCLRTARFPTHRGLLNHVGQTEQPGAHGIKESPKE